MNERIKQLAVQAGMNIVDDKFSTYGKFAEKFAELIVRECQHRVEQYINECGEVASMPDTVIMKHFGVEE
jgi:monomeric isocitrate dehydrogenase